MTIDIDKLRAELEADSRRFLIKALVVGAVCFTAGLAFGFLVLN